ncbi:MAG: glycosyltransferase family 4 protein [Bacteroidota bacterium]
MTGIARPQLDAPAEVRPRLLVVSHVLPFPGRSGQQQRVANTLRALRGRFNVTFLTVAPEVQIAEVREGLAARVDEAVVLPSIVARESRVLHAARAATYLLKTGLKISNYRIAEVELTPERVAGAVRLGSFSGVLVEYWHAHSLAPMLREHGVPVALDTHNVLWQAYERQLRVRRLPVWWKRRVLAKYREAEERAWAAFDALVTINAAEDAYVRSRVPESVEVVYTPMGIDLEGWPPIWQFSAPPRVAYYGGLSSPHNQRDALAVAQTVMPEVWREHPEAELFIIGSKPPDFLRALAEADPRVTVTGFVPRVQDVLGRATVVVCPWEGTYGFRSRLVEVMALGVPVITTPDAVFGMDLEHERGLLLAEDLTGLIQETLRLLADSAFASRQSALAREETERRFSMESTYGALADWLRAWCRPPEPVSA